MSDTVSIQDLLSGKVRLEFGNAGQLKAIRMYEQQKESMEKMCPVCDGEGMVTCNDCEGTGEKP